MERFLQIMAQDNRLELPDICAVHSNQSAPATRVRGGCVCVGGGGVDPPAPVCVGGVGVRPPARGAELGARPLSQTPPHHGASASHWRSVITHR